ncbi:iron chaperone [Virgibacillus pantothenticus]|uniref:iron chaperone n=1 Tax=Virgibacillus pantothenticus TaxID=1473 RepID=UPI000986B2F4|nr:iron chaperone [Virgibacillus pantothenticus]
MEVFTEYLAKIDNPKHRTRMEELFAWITKKFPNLKPEIKWNQPMFTDHGTFIIAFSMAKHHLSVSPERAGMVHFSNEIVQSGYDHTKELVRIPWDDPVDFSLLEKMIEFNMMDKANCTSFWRK